MTQAVLLMIAQHVSEGLQPRTLTPKPYTMTLAVVLMIALAGV
jgi:hypothetical protein